MSKISIRVDVESRKVKDDTKSEVGYWGSKVPPQEDKDDEGVYIDTLQKIMKKRNYMGVHEHLVGDQYRPYADFDMSKGITEANFKERHLELAIMGTEVMLKAFPQEEGELEVWCSSGQKPDGTWKVSLHFIMNGIYFEKKEYIRHELAKVLGDPSTWEEKGWDKGVYNKNHLMRVAFCTKPNDTRKLRLMVVRSVGQMQYVHYPTEDIEELSRGLITYTEPGDVLISKPDDYKEQPTEKAGEDEVGDDVEDGEEDEVEKIENEVKKGKRKPWSEWTYVEAEDVISRLHDTRAATHDDRIKGLLSIVHLARAVKKVAKFKTLAHLFAKKDPKYSEADADDDWDYAKKTKKVHDKPRTFASLMAQAKVDNPQAKVAAQLPLDTEIPLTNYDDLDKLLAKKPMLQELQVYLMGCLRFCSSKGSEQWFQHSSDGWWPIKNRKDNFPFGSTSSNRKFKDTTLFDMMQELQGTELFKAKCQTQGTEFYPFFGEDSRPNIINTFHGWPHKPSGKSEESPAVKAFVGHSNMMWGEKAGKYVLDGLAKKLRFPRWRGKLGCGYGQFGGEGKNLFEAFVTGVFGRAHCLSTPGTKLILGQGEAGFNPLAEHALIVFIQEAKADGKSVTCNELFKNWLTNDVQQIRKMRENPCNAGNYAMSFMWTNHLGFLRADAATLRRLYAEKISAEKMWDKAYFDEMWAIAQDPKAQQEIFDWLLARDISDFKEEDKPVTDLMKRMAEDSLTPVQQYIVDLCNGDREAIEADENGDAHEPAMKVYQDFEAYCQEHGVRNQYVNGFKGFKTALESLNITHKQDRHEDFGLEAKTGKNKRGMCFTIEAVEVEKVMQNLQKDQKWNLLRPVLADDQ